MRDLSRSLTRFPYQPYEFRRKDSTWNLMRLKITCFLIICAHRWFDRNLEIAGETSTGLGRDPSLDLHDDVM